MGFALEGHRAECHPEDDGWGELARSADPAADQRQGRPKDCTAPPVMGRLGADLEKKRQPRVASSAKAQLQEAIRVTLDTGRDSEAVLAADKAHIIWGQALSRRRSY